MRIISRRENEGLVIDGNIEVTILEIHDDHVRLGISSPDNDPPYREQVLYVDQADCLRELQLN